MKNLNLKNCLVILGCITIFGLFLKENISAILFIGFIFFSLVNLIEKKKKNIILQRTSKIIIVLMVAYFLIGVTGVIINPESKKNYLTRLLPFLFSPFLFYIFQDLRNKNMLFIKCFVLGNIILLVFLDISAIIDMITNQSLFIVKEGREYYRFLYTRYTNPNYFNHIYLSLYTFFSAILIYQFKLTTSRLKWITLTYFFIHLFMIGSRAMIISILFGSLIYLFILAIIKKKHLKYLFIYIFCIASLFSITYVFKDTLLFNRYSQVFEWYGKRDNILERNYSINNRIKIYILGASVINEGNGGIQGTGIAEEKIKNTYSKKFKNEFPFKTKTYNTHNQFINNYIDWGYAGLITLSLLLILVIKQAIEKQNYALAFFWISFTLLLMMECILYRQRGIMLFVIFFALLENTSKSNILNPNIND